MDHQKYNIAWILSSADHHIVARSFFYDCHEDDHDASLNITYSTGKVGEHYVVAARKDPATTTSDTADIVDSLQQLFPSIQAAFLVNPEATAPGKGPATIGSVVIGTRPNLQSGLIHFDTMETRREGRLVTTYAPRHVPGAVAMAIEGLLNEKGREDWRRILKSRLPCPQLQPNAFRGVIASSTQALDDEALIDRIGEENKILCFDTTAASIKSHSLVVVAGIASHTRSEQSCLPSAEVCINVISYLSCLTKRIDADKIRLEPPLASLYNYKPFDLERPGFRLLRLKKGSKNDPIHCQLSQAYLQEKYNREEETIYEALSYCWGENPRFCKKINVDDKVFFITETLLKALKNLRFDDRDRTIWIDALCIDQSNIRERGHQVGWMTNVYEHASRVLFWLGDVGYKTGFLFSLLKRFEQDTAQAKAWDNLPLDDPAWSGYWNDARDNEKAYDYESELKSLMTNPWFSRVWILQEVAKARQASVGCNWGWVDSKAFAMAPALLGVQPDSQSQAIIDIMPGPLRKSSWWAQKPNICTLMWRFRESQASDPRDRLYALVGLASDGDSITADYTKTQEAVVREIAVYLFGDKIPPSTFSQWDIANLQRRIPNLAAIALEKMVLSGSGLGDVQEFVRWQNPTVPLSEAAINYAWCTRPDSDLMDYFETDHTFQEIVLFGIIPANLDMKSTVAKADFLNEKRGYLEITSYTLQALHRNGEDVPKLILERVRDDIKVNEDLVNHIANHWPKSFMSLLDRHGSEFEITRDTIMGLKSGGLDVFNIIATYPRDRITITKDLMEEAHGRSPESLSILLERGKVTDDVVKVAAGQSYGETVTRLLLDRRSEEVKITEDLVKAAAGSMYGCEMMTLLLERRGEEIKITEDIVKAAVGAIHGEKVLELLLDQRGDEVEITRDVLSVAEQNRSSHSEGSKVLMLLWDRRPKEVSRLVDRKAMRGVPF